MFFCFSLSLSLSLSPFFVLWLSFCNPSRLQLCSPFFYSFLVRYCFTAFICLFDLLLFANKVFWLLCMASHVDTSPHKQSLESHPAVHSPLLCREVIVCHDISLLWCTCVPVLYLSARQFLFYLLERGWEGTGANSYKGGMKHSVKALVFLRIRYFRWEKPVFMCFH